MATSEIMDRIIAKAQQAGIEPTVAPGSLASNDKRNYMPGIALQLGMDPGHYNLYDMEKALDEILGIDNDDYTENEEYYDEDDTQSEDDSQSEEEEEVESEEDTESKSEESSNESESSNNVEQSTDQKKSGEKSNESEAKQNSRPQQQNRQRANQNNQNNNNGLNNKYRKNQKNPANPNTPGVKKPGANPAQKGAADAAKTAGKASAAKQGAKEAAKNATAAAKETLKTLSKNPKFWIILGIVLFVIFVVIFICVSVANNTQGGELQDQVPYVQIKHNDTVKVKIDGQIETISLDEYVAGVLYHEIAGFADSPETLKAFAIAARTNVQILMRYSPYADSYKSDGYLKNSNMLSYKKVSKNSKYMKAAEETTGMVLVSSIKDPKYYWAFFDAIAFKSSCGGKQTDSTVILCQKGVEIPISWLKKHGNWSTMQNQSAHASHGKGMSQWGAYYLGKEKKKTALELLELFYSEAKVITFIPNKSTEKDDDEDKKFSIDCNNISFSTTPGYSQLTTNIKSFLSGKGTSLKSINNGLRDRVAEAGPGTRCAVVTAAKYTVESLSKYKVRMRYFWGGKHPTTYGFHKSWGSSAYAKNKYGTTYHYSGLDCGTYIQWIYKNAGINLSSGQFGSRGKHHSVGSYTGKPGDVLYKKGSHVMLILKYVKSSNAYYVAEAANKKDGVRIRKAKVSNLKSNGYKVVDMSSYFGSKSASKYKSNFNNGRKD